MSKTIVVVHGTLAASKEGVTQWYELGKDHKHGFMNQVEAVVAATTMLVRLPGACLDGLTQMFADNGWRPLRHYTRRSEPC